MPDRHSMEPDHTVSQACTFIWQTTIPTGEIWKKKKKKKKESRMLVPTVFWCTAAWCDDRSEDALNEAVNLVMMLPTTVPCHDALRRFLHV